MTVRRRTWMPTAGWRTGLSLLAALLLITGAAPTGQIQYLSGQNVAPDYQGWEVNPDGSFEMIFGYMNRNYEEHPYIPVGPNNSIEPGGPDRGQPTYFLPRRNRNVVRIKVPADFGKKELVWTLTVNGKTERAYGSLKPDYAHDKGVQYLNSSGMSRVGRAEKNQAPVVTIEGAAQRTATVGEPLALSAVATDDGVPAPRAAPRGSVGFRSSVGLRVSWFVFRGPGDTVTFDPEQIKVYPDVITEGGNSPWTPGWAPPPLPKDNKFPVNVTFAEPGTYVVRILAHDGGAEAAKDITVTVQAKQK
jgi:hypothetical protein